MNIYRSALSACVIMGLPNVYDYIHKHRERLMEEKRQKILLSETARHGQHRTAIPDVSNNSIHTKFDIYIYYFHLHLSIQNQSDQHQLSPFLNSLKQKERYSSYIYL